MSGNDDSAYECHVCSAPADTHIAGYRIARVDLMLPHRFVFAYRDRRKRLGLCNRCFEAQRFDGFTPDEIAYFARSSQKLTLMRTPSRKPAMQLTASKPAVYAFGICRRARMLRFVHRGLAAADLLAR